MMVKTNFGVTFPFKELGKYYNLWSLVFSPLVTHTLVNCQMCKIGSSLL
jgi:hypothetical protein